MTLALMRSIAVNLGTNAGGTRAPAEGGFDTGPLLGLPFFLAMTRIPLL
jgi:hypothetical protein